MASGGSTADSGSGRTPRAVDSRWCLLLRIGHLAASSADSPVAFRISEGKLPSVACRPLPASRHHLCLFPMLLCSADPRASRNTAHKLGPFPSLRSPPQGTTRPPPSFMTLIAVCNSFICLFLSCLDHFPHWAASSLRSCPLEAGRWRHSLIYAVCDLVLT